MLAYGPLPKVPVDSRSVMKRLLSDKKTVGGVPHFVLPTAIGKVEVVNNVPAAHRYPGDQRDQGICRKRSLGHRIPNRKSTVAWRAHRGRGAGGRARRSSAAADAVRDMFTSIAPRYDLLNHVLSMNIDRLWWNRTARVFTDVLRRPDAQVLDLCCGTGDMTFALHRRLNGAPTKLIGADFSHAMLVRAEQKSGNRNIRWVEADALNLPFRFRPVSTGDVGLRISQPGELRSRAGGNLSRAGAGRRSRHPRLRRT